MSIYATIIILSATVAIIQILYYWNYAKSKTYYSSSKYSNGKKTNLSVIDVGNVLVPNFRCRLSVCKNPCK